MTFEGTHAERPRTTAKIHRIRLEHLDLSPKSEMIREQQYLLTRMPASNHIMPINLNLALALRANSSL
jgi:hypothetical protein